MRNLTIAGALAALIFAPLPAMAQAGGGATVVSGATCPSTTVLAVGNNRPLIETQQGALCTNASGGGGGGNAAAGLTGAAVPTSAGYTGFNVSGNLVGVSAANPLPITASGGAVGLLSGSQTIGAVNGTVTPGTTNATTGYFPIAGYDAANSLSRSIRTDAFGGMIGGSLTGTATRTVLTASTDTALPGATATTRPSYLRVTVETTLTANLFLCLNNQTCSATVYDEMIPSGAAAGTRLFEETPFTLAVRYFTTGTPTVNATRLAN